MRPAAWNASRLPSGDDAPHRGYLIGELGATIDCGLPAISEIVRLTRALNGIVET